MKKISLVKTCLFIALIFLTLMLASCMGGNSTYKDHRHEWSEWNIIEIPTCIAEGRAEKECACGASSVKMIKASPHSEGDWITDKAATVSEAGLKHQICSVCGTALEYKTVPWLNEDLLPFITDEKQDESRPHYQLGNCRNLEGNPVVVLIYINDDESGWTEQEVLKYTNEQVYLALQWLEKNAKDRGVMLDFTVEIYSTHLCGYEIKYEGIVNPDLDNGGSTKDVLDKAAEDIGYVSNWGMYTYYKQKYPDEEIIFLNLVNKPGRSYTRVFVLPGCYTFSEHSVLFAAELNSSSSMRQKGTRSASVANHILRLYGAENLYTTAAREALAEQLYPNDIMLWSNSDITENSVGDYTAFSVGWADEAPEVCDNPDWW